MMTERVFEIHTSKLLSEWTGLYLLHGWRQVRDREGETRAHIPRRVRQGLTFPEPLMPESITCSGMHCCSESENCTQPLPCYSSHAAARARGDAA